MQDLIESRRIGVRVFFKGLQDALLELLVNRVELPIVHVSVHPVEHDWLSDLYVDAVCKQGHYLIGKFRSFVFNMHLICAHSQALIAHGVEFTHRVLSTWSATTEFTLCEELTLDLVILHCWVVVSLRLQILA